MMAEEVRAIFRAQRQLGQPFASEKLESRYLDILLSQRSFDEGPGEGSPYAGSQIERMIGKCTLEDGEQRAAKATYSFEYFTLLQNVNHLRLLRGGEGSPLTPAQREALIALAHKTKELNFSHIRRELAIPADTTFNAVYYKNTDDAEEAEKKTKFSYLKAYHQMRTAFNKLSKTTSTPLPARKRTSWDVSFPPTRPPPKFAPRCCLPVCRMRSLTSPRHYPSANSATFL